MDKKFLGDKKEGYSKKDDPHNIEISPTGYGYLPLEAKTEEDDTNTKKEADK